MTTKNWPRETVIIDCEERRIGFVNASNDLVEVCFPEPSDNTDTFLLCCSIAIAQDLKSANGPTQWPGVREEFLSSVIGHYGWNLGLGSVNTYWNDFRHGNSGIRPRVTIHLNGDIPEAQDELASELFQRRRAYILGSRKKTVGGTYSYWPIEVVNPNDEYQRLRDFVVGLAGSKEVRLKTVSTPGELKGIRSSLIEEVKKYLENLAERCAELPTYYPEHLRNSSSGKTPFDELRQTVQVVSDRKRLDQWLAQEKERLVRQGLDPETLVYGPRRGMPEEEEGFDKKSKVETLDWDERASGRYKRAVILGDPGFGKTWLLKYEARQMALAGIQALEASCNLESITLPLFLRLSDLAASDAPLEESVIEFISKEYKHTETFCDYVRHQLDKNRCVLLLDAWDEVSTKLALQKRVAAFAREFNHPRILLTSRIVGYETSLPPLPGAKELELLSFKRSAIESFAEIWFGEYQEKAKAFLRKLQSQPQIKGLARIPLMLGLLCRAYPEGDFVGKRSEVYERCLKGLLKDWVLHDQKSGVKDRELESARVELQLNKLGLLALELFKQGCEQFTPMMLVDILEEKFNEDKALELIDLLKHRGILVAANSSEDPPLLFLHRTFQEYLAARALAKQSDVIDFALNPDRLYDPTWHEVLRLLGGLLGDRTPRYLAALLRENRNDYLCRPFLLTLDVIGEVDSRYLPEGFIQDIAQVIGMMFCNKSCPINITPDHFVALRDSPKVIDLFIRGVGVQNTYQVGDIAEGIYDVICVPRAVGPLIEALKDEDVHLFAIEALGVIGSPEAISPLVQLLGDKNISVRQYAAEALGRIGSLEAIDPLIETLKDKDPMGWVPRAAAGALIEIGSSEAVGLLVETLKDEDSSVRQLAMKVLVAIDSEAVGLFKEKLKDEDGDIRSLAADALGEIGFPESTVPLIEALKDEKWSVRSMAARALGVIGSPEAIGPLVEALKKDEESYVRHSAAEALSMIDSPGAVCLLVKLLRDENDMVRRCVAEALGAIGSSKAISPLAEALKDRSDSVCRSAAKALDAIGSPEAIGPLIDALREEDDLARNSAAEALGAIGTLEAIGPSERMSHR